MQADLSPVIAATAQWLTRAFPASGGALASALCEVQARQAVTVAAWLRYPTAMDAALLDMAGPGGSGRLDWITGVDATLGDDTDAHAWRTWVDEVVASWAACLLTDPELAARAVAALADGSHGSDGSDGSDGSQGTPVPAEFRRLIAPDDRDRSAAVLLRHPDLLAPVADLHQNQLLDRLNPGRTLIA
ncbi:hypothetical protein [Streptomyces cahuitamycinicus]|uniref:Uncharacterized protein n=1 Tax=Streptomyces cahuitamycinicus TaxID=2070367 RepID=A0A2N8TET6_9ACTN|nr:hypothetical protein [Streptomyces cahuitamycinicus]PNG17543.1 hypothetical protein C1J00_35915 [Streptomyces cahuitamycinicus]